MHTGSYTSHTHTRTHASGPHAVLTLHAPPAHAPLTPLSHTPSSHTHAHRPTLPPIPGCCVLPALPVPTPIGATLPRVSGRPGEPGGSLGRGGVGSVPKTAQAMGSFQLLWWVVGGRLCGVGEAGLTPPGCSPMDIEAEARAAPCGARVS